MIDSENCKKLMTLVSTAFSSDTQSGIRSYNTIGARWATPTIRLIFLMSCTRGTSTLISARASIAKESLI